MASNVHFDAVNAMRYVTMRVNIERTRELRFRVWLAIRLLRLMSWILNCNIKFEGTDD